MLACVANLSEGRRGDLIATFARACGGALLDRHSDPWHNRSVFTLAGPDVLEVALNLAGAVIELLDLTMHGGVHPRLGVIDVVPFTPLPPERDPDLPEALAARDEFARRLSDERSVPCFCYGPERSLPEIRRGAFGTLLPDFGPRWRHPRAGACCVGARPPLVAYNLVLAEPDLTRATAIARQLRSPSLRALGLSVGAEVQVSCNLVAPYDLGPAQAYDAVAGYAPVARGELVGLVPKAVLDAVPPSRWAALGLSPEATFEARLEAAGLPRS